MVLWSLIGVAYEFILQIRSYEKLVSCIILEITLNALPNNNKVTQIRIIIVLSFRFMPSISSFLSLIDQADIAPNIRASKHNIRE